MSDPTPRRFDPNAAMADAVRRYRAGQRDGALEICRRILAAHPDHAGAAHLAGVVEAEAGHLGEAVRLLGRAVELAPGNAAAHAALAASLAGSGRPIDAVEAYRRALSAKPDLTAARIRLGDLLADLGRRGEAIDCYRQAASDRPMDAMLKSNLGSLLAEEAEWDRAIAEFRAALAIDAGLKRTHANLGTALKEIGRMEEAVASFRAALAIDPAEPSALTGLGAALLRQQDAAGAVEALTKAVAASPVATRALCYLAIALTAAGRTDEALTIADPDSQVTITDLPLPDGFESLDTFNASLIADVTEHPTLVWEPGGKTTRGGAQTGNLLQQPTPTIRAFEAALRQAIDDALDDLATDAEHPHFRRLPGEYILNSWGTVLQESGRQLSHIHASAWLSGVYYAELPQATGADGTAGWIEFGRPGYGLPEPDGIATRLVEPKVGRLVLFPSFLFHNTVPFSGDDRRISIAFDLLPRSYR